MKTLTSTIILTALVAKLSIPNMGQSAPQPVPIQPNAINITKLEKAGDLTHAQKNYEHTITYFQTALRKDKKNTVLYNKLDLSYLKQSNLPKTHSNFEKATKRNSKYADTLNNVGAVFYIQRNYSSAARYFKKALALKETRPAFHVNLKAAWFSQNKLKQTITKYDQTLQLDPKTLTQNNQNDIAAQISNPKKRAHYDYMLAKLYARMGDTEQYLRCLKKAKEDKYKNIANVYKDEEFSRLWQNSQLSEIAPQPAAKQLPAVDSGRVRLR